MERTWWDLLIESVDAAEESSDAPLKITSLLTVERGIVWPDWISEQNKQ